RTSSAGATARWHYAGAPPACSKPITSSAASTATCTCRNSGPRSKRTSGMSVPPPRMKTRKRHDDHGGRHRSSTELGTTSLRRVGGSKVDRRMRNVPDGLPSERVLAWAGRTRGTRSCGSVRPGPLGLDGVSVDRGADLFVGDRPSEGLFGPCGGFLRGRWFGHRRADLVRPVVVLALEGGGLEVLSGPPSILLMLGYA